MKFKSKLKILLLKRYFDTGYGLTNPLKYFIAFFGLASRDVLTTMTISLIWGILCFIIGYFYIKTDFYKADNELTNKYNPFVSEMRKKIKNRKV